MWSIAERILLCPLHYKCHIGPSVDIKNAVSGNWRCNDLLFLVTKVCFYFFKFSVVYVEKKSKKTKLYKVVVLLLVTISRCCNCTLLHLLAINLTVGQPCISQCKRDIIYLLHLDKVKLEYCQHSEIMHRSWREMQIKKFEWRKIWKMGKMWNKVKKEKKKIRKEPLAAKRDRPRNF